MLQERGRSFIFIGQGGVEDSGRKGVFGTESYDPLWTARIDSINGKPAQETIRPVPLYSVINGFYVNQTGDLDITIEYEPQKWFYAGAAVSVVTLIASIGYLVYDWRRKKDEIIQIKKQSAWRGWKR